MNLSRNEASILEALSETRETTIESLIEEIDIARGPAEQAARELAGKELVELSEDSRNIYELTDEGEKYIEDGLPERRAFEYIMGKNGVSIDELREEIEEFDIAIGHMKRKNWIDIDNGYIEAGEAPRSNEEEALDKIDRGMDLGDDEAGSLIDRNLADSKKIREITLRITEKGSEVVAEGLEIDSATSRLTHEMLAEGSWKEYEFSHYNVEAESEEIHGGKVHILRQLADRVKKVFISMGFEEMEGPHVDSEFYINDCLFMPQDHPARTHWDKFLVEEPSHIDSLPEDLVENIRDTHLEGVDEGEGYHSEWSEDVARLLNLRGHTTSLSMRYISGGVEPPAKYFSVDKVYRNDTLDPTHLLEFFQIEGWVMAKDLSVRDLMGTFDEFYSRFGITDLEFKPHYNPYTEPSFEIFGDHPETGEMIEIGNSGMFRREVLDPLGVDRDVEVIAWGLALERLLMLIYGFEDIRDVHGTLCDLKLLREVPELWR